MVLKLLAMIGSHDDDALFEQSTRAQRIHHQSELLIDKGHLGLVETLQKRLVGRIRMRYPRSEEALVYVS